MFHPGMLIRYAGPFCCSSCSDAIDEQDEWSAHISPLGKLPLVNIAVVFRCPDANADRR